MAALASSPLTNRVLAVTIVVLLVAGVVSAVARAGDDGGDGGDAAVPTTDVPATTSTTASPQAMDDLVHRLQGFVAATRGLAYKAPVKVTLLDDAAFRARLKQGEEQDTEEIRAVEGILKALGLMNHDVDLKKAADSLAGDAIAGFYDDDTKELVVRGAAPTPFVRAVLVHELTHALDDQWFNLHRPELDKDSEAAAGFEGLIEGNAVRVQDAYLRSLPAAERRAAAEEESSQGDEIDPDIPEVLLTAVGFPYVAGPQLVQTLLRAGGQARLDEAFRHPPLSTEQLMDPQRYLAGDNPRPVAAPKADGKVIDEEYVGELFLYLTLREGLDDGVARRAAQGWGGDRYVAWRDGDKTCVRETFVMDTPADQAELVDAFRQWVDVHEGATADGTTLTACG